MVRRRSCAVSNHEARGPSFVTRRWKMLWPVEAVDAE
jgi:hypothetical protein